MSEEEPLESDRAGSAPHPRHAPAPVGQETAAAEFLRAWAGERMHHAWLITGPRGVGKATLAWAIARFLLAGPGAEPPGGGLFGETPVPERLTPDADAPEASRVAALSDQGLMLLRPSIDDRGKPRAVIRVDEARSLKKFLSLSSPDGRPRVVLIDAADQLNTAAANAILKLLEEPPQGVVFLLVAHSPARLLPTIRSRCRVLRCAQLGPQDLARALRGIGKETAAELAEAGPLAELAAGSVGEAVRLVESEGVALYADLVALFGAIRFDRARLMALANSMAGPAGADRFDTAVRLIDIMLGRLARHGAGMAPAAEAAQGEAEMLARLAPGADAGRRWAELQQLLSQRLGHGRAVNLDPSSLLLDTGLAIHETAQKTVLIEAP